MEFENILGKDSALLHSVRERGFITPSEIQKKSIPEILKGKDVIAGASTGSGKTLAFAAGLVHNVKKDFGIQGLVLTPTRELAEQISNELSDFSKKKDLDVISVYGGVSINDQMRRLPRADIVVGTPGRILDHIDRNSIDLSRINTLVLDEADRMLDMGFRDDVEKIISKCSKKRQTLLFSATISDDIVHLAKRYMNNPVEISAESQVDPTKMEQVYYDVEDGLKYSLLKYLLEHEESKLAMVFCNTRKNVDFVANNLQAEGIEALPIHGGFSQEKRNKILENFHSKKVKVLIATDVAARGLDIDGVTHIYNYDSPPTKKEYVHRIGRTARAGNEGKVINIIASRDYENFHNLMNAEFKIILMETPFIERARIKWVPQRRSMERDSRFGNRGRSSGFSGRGNSRSGGRDNRRNDGRRSFGGRNSRSDDGRRNDRDDDRGNSRRGRFSNRNGNNHRRF
jgi:ATP-dependent RNA helicase DeaD